MAFDPRCTDASHSFRCSKSRLEEKPIVDLSDFEAMVLAVFAPLTLVAARTAFCLFERSLSIP